MKRTRLSTCLLLTALLAGGCLFSSSDPDDDSGEPPLPYPERTTPENVLEKLVWAYGNMELDAYMDCLADDFTFWLNPDDVDDDPCLPLCWNKGVERTIHENMFDEGSDVDTLQLDLMQYGDPTEFPSPIPEEPSTWQYDEQVDLWVNLRDGCWTQLHANCGARFVFQVDPNEVGSGGEDLWEIVEWYDLDKWHARAFEDVSVEDCTWGKIKAVYR